LSIVRARPERIGELATLVEDENWLVSLRALDVLEKLAHDRPDWIGPYKQSSSVVWPRATNGKSAFRSCAPCRW
jgi:hypothetical protein